MTDSSKTPAAPAKDAQKTPRTAQVTREPFGGRRMRLSFPEEYKDPGYFYYWFRDEGDNLWRARSAGYAEVTYEECGRLPPREGTGKDACVAFGGVGEAGRPYNMALMKLPVDLRAEDEAAAAKLADEIDSSIFRTEFEGGKYGHHNVQVKDEE